LSAGGEARNKGRLGKKLILQEILVGQLTPGQSMRASETSDKGSPNRHNEKSKFTHRVPRRPEPVLSRVKLVIDSYDYN